MRKRKQPVVPERTEELSPEQLFELGMRTKYGRRIQLGPSGPVFSPHPVRGDMAHASADLSLLKQQEQEAYWHRAGLGR